MKSQFLFTGSSDVLTVDETKKTNELLVPRDKTSFKTKNTKNKKMFSLVYISTAAV